MPNSLDELVAALDAAQGRYTTRELIKESAEERTELVECADGTLRIRKFIAWPYDEPHPYERLAGLDLPRMPKVFETTRLDGVLMAVTEYLEGESLETALRRGPLGDNGVLALLGYLEAALTALHTMPGGPVIHRDVNPANIMLTRDGAYLVDFGIARSWRDGATSDTRLLGTEGYAAPEQFGFRQTDPRTDVYALAQTLRTCLTGAAPSTHAPLPHAWQAKVINKASALSPDARYPSVEAFAEAYRQAARRRQGVVLNGVPDTTFALRGLTDRSTPARVVWRIWQIALTAVLALWMFGMFLIFAVNKRFDDIPAAIASTALWVVIPYVVLANPLRATSQIPWLQDRRYLKLALILAGSFCALLVIAAVFPGMFASE